MNIKKNRIHNFVNFSLFMNNVTYLYYENSHFTKKSVNDIKSLFLGKRYLLELLKLKPKIPLDIFNLDVINKITDFSMIHRDSA